MNCIQNKQKCSCSYTSCSKWGKCCECIVYHKDQNQLPACYFPKDLETLGTRDIDAFIDKVWNK